MGQALDKMTTEFRNNKKVDRYSIEDFDERLEHKILDPIFMETPTKEEIKTILRVHCNQNVL